MPRAKKAAPTEPSTDPAVHAVAAANPPAPAEADTRYQRLTPKERKAVTAQAKKLYREGLSITAVAAELGKSYGWTQRALAEANVKIRSRGGSKPKK